MNGGCRFPLWPHRAQPTQEFCGDPIVPESRYPYCVQHRFVCTVQPGRPDPADEAPDADTLAGTGRSGTSEHPTTQ